MSTSPPAVVADRYRLIAPLGQGGMGRVWRATDVVLHRDVAIKELVPPPGLTPGERQEMRERSLREARAIARLNNVNVVRVFDVLRTHADPWIVMEYVPSRSLQDTLAAEGPFNPIRAAEIGLGVLGALRAAHRAGVVHRDVKPGNVLLGADGRVVLTDFGLATVPGDPNVTRTGLVLGSPAYIAPERAREGTAGPAADLWSLGATLYAAVEGASPFARPSAIATLAALATENPPPARNAGPLKPVLNGLLRKDPAHRINAEEAERLLNRAAGRRSKLAFPMSPTMRRPGVGRDRLGAIGPTGTNPVVVPGPRPPVAPARPVEPPGRQPLAGGHPAAGEGRPPVYVPGKAPVGRSEVDRPTRVDAPRLDATRVDAPPVKDEKTTKFFGTRDRSTTASGQPPGSPPVRPSFPSANPASRTNRGEPGAFTAEDVAAYRRRKAASEREQPPAEATALVGRVDTPPAEPTTVVRGPVADATSVISGPPTDATTVVGAPSVAAPTADATTVVGGRPAIVDGPPADATTVVSGPPTVVSGPPSVVDGPPADATTVVSGPPATSADATTVVPAPQRSRKKAKAAPPKAKPAETKQPAEPEAKVVAPSTVSPSDEKPSDAAADASTETDETGTTPKSDQTDKSEMSAGAIKKSDAEAPEREAPEKDEQQPSGAVEEINPDPKNAEKSEKSSAAVQVPLTRPAPPTAEPQAEPTESEAEPTESKTELADSTAEPIELEAEPIEPETELAEPEAELDQPEAASGEPEAELNQPAADSGVPEAELHQLAAESADAEPSEPTTTHPSAPTTKLPSGPTDSPAAPGEPTAEEDADDLALISPPISRSTRPAWRPMEVRPSARPGVTIFGTRLTYTQAGIGGAVLLVVLVLLIVLAVQVFGSSDTTTPPKPKAAPTATGKPTTTGSSSTGGASAAASSAPSGAPSSQSPTSSSPGAFVLPAGWKMYTQRATSNAPAFSIPIPNGTRITGGPGVTVEFSWGPGGHRLLIVDRTDTPQPDAFQDLKDKAAAGSNKSGYSFIKIGAVKYRDFDSTADWEYLYNSDAGNPQHVVRRNIRVDAHRAYMLSWYVSPQDWGPGQRDLQTIYQGFQPG